MIKKPTVRKWIDRIERARKAREEEESDWDENRQMLNAVSYTDAPSKYDRVWVNHFLSLTRIIIPLLYYKNPEFTALPEREQDTRSYRIAQEAINYWARVIGLKFPAKEALLDALVASFGVMKVGWVIEQVDVKLKINPDGSQELVDESQDQPLSGVQYQLIQAGIGSRPFTVRISPWNFIRNVGSTSVKNASWVAERFFKRLEEVKNDPLYKNTEKLTSNAQPLAETYGPDGAMVIPTGSNEHVTAATALADPDDELVCLWEVWDRSDPSKPVQLVLAEGVDEPLLEREWPYDLDGRFPYLEVRMIDVPDEAYPIPFLSAIKELVRELNIVASYELDFVKRASPKIAYDKTRINDDSDLKALQRGEPIQAIGVTGDPNSAFGTVGGVALNPDLKYVHEQVEKNIALISGVADFMRGGNADASQLATVANIQTQALSMMVQDMQDRVSDLMTEWARDIDMLAKEFADKPTMIRITGQVGFDWQTFSKTDLQGSYEYRVVPGSLQPINRDIELKQRLDLLNLLGPFINPATTQINGTELIRSIAELFPIKNLDKILGTEAPPPPADPAEENFLLQEGGSPVVSPEENFQEHLQLHMAYLQQVASSPQPDRDLIYRVNKHIQDTQRTQMMLMVQAQMQQAQAGSPTDQATASPASKNGGPPGTQESPQTPAQRPSGNAGPSKPTQLQQQAPQSGYNSRPANTRNPPFPGSAPQ